MSIAVLVALIFSKYFYLASLSSYYTFYLISKFASRCARRRSICSSSSARSPPARSSAARSAIASAGSSSSGCRSSACFRSRSLLPHANLFWTRILTVVIGLILASAFSAIVVYAQELVPGRVGMISGLFFGFAFGMGGLGAAVLGWLADATSIEFVYRICAFLPLIGMLTAFLPDVEKHALGILSHEDAKDTKNARRMSCTDLLRAFVSSWLAGLRAQPLSTNL